MSCKEINEEVLYNWYLDGQKGNEMLCSHLSDCQKCQASLKSFKDVEGQFQHLQTIGLTPGGHRSSPQAPLPSSIGPFKVLGKIAEGGMGIIYKGHDPSLNRVVALKQLQVPVSKSNELLQRLQNEARAVAKLRHPSIVQVYSTGIDKHQPYIAMEYIPGPNLHEKLRRNGIMSPDEFLVMATEISEGLKEAHDQNIIHRDIKPANILVDEKNARRYKLTDFGTARVMDELPVQTTDGQVMGTLNYMSPEQIQGLKVDERSDIFSFGCLLYECATGKKAFKSQNYPSLVREITTVDPMEKGLFPREHLCIKLVQQCLAKSPNDRPRSMGDVLLLLRSCSSGQSVAPEIKKAVGSLEESPLQSPLASNWQDLDMNKRERQRIAQCLFEKESSNKRKCDIL